MLGKWGIEVHCETSAEAALALCPTLAPDLVLSDWMMPGIDGLEFCRRFRALPRDSYGYFILLTSKSEKGEVARGLDAGADDYVTKPFHVEEVLARVRALIRRAAGHASSEIRCGPLTIDTKSSKAMVDGITLKLTSHEYRLLSYLGHHVGEVVSRTELIEHLYDQDFDRDSNTIEVFVGRLRKKIGHDIIETVRGLGYRMSVPDEPGEKAS